MIVDGRIPGTVDAMLTWWLGGVRDIVGGYLHSVLLTGSTAMGDFCPRWSDVDVCVVLEEPIREHDAARIGAFHDWMRRRYLERRHDGWASPQAIEGYYVPRQIVADRSWTAPCYVTGARSARWVSCDPVTPFDRYVLARHALACHGPGLEVEPPDPTELAAQTLKDTAELAGWATQSPVWQAGMLHWAARTLGFWRDGELRSKSAALRHEIGAGSRHAGAFRLALALREQGTDRIDGRAEELAACLAQCADPMAVEIRALVSAAWPASTP